MSSPALNPSLPVLQGVISDEVSQDYSRVVAFAQEQKLDGIELRSAEGKAFKDLTVAQIDEIARKTEDTGLRIPCVSTPVFKCSVDDPSDILQHIDLFKRSVEHARRLGAGIVRVFAFLRKEQAPTPDDLRIAAERFQPLVEALKGSDVRIGLENESSTLVCTGAETRTFLKALNRPEVGVVWDPCNILFIPGNTQPTTDDYNEIADRIIHVHVKDAVHTGDTLPSDCVELGTGSLDFPAQMAGLKKNKYRGWITLETHWRQKALTQEARHLPAGYAFSDNAEEPTRICLEHLRRFVQQA